MNVIFMGTPDFAVPCLESLIKYHHVCAVFTQPDKPVGRKQIITQSDVKVCALSHNIKVFQPESFKDGSPLETISQYKPDVIVVAAYGKILPKEILECCKYGCINVHASLLPKYRGAAPIQWSVINGDGETGVSIMQMSEGLDTGDILYTEKTDISINETSAELFNRLSVIGADALIKTLDMLESGNITPIKQDDNSASYVKKITKPLGKIDWNMSAVQVHNLIRGLQTWPCAFTTINGKTVKIHKSALTDGKSASAAGAVVENNSKLTVSCGDGKCIDILVLQPEGKKKMEIKAYLAGHNVNIGTILGE